MYNEVNVLDTNVLIDNPRAILAFPDSLTVLPNAVMEELDKLKDSKDGNVRRMARITSWLLDEITEANIGKVIMDNGAGGALLIDDERAAINSYNPDKPDNRIISTAVAWANELGKDGRVVMHSNDVNVRVITRKFASHMYKDEYQDHPEDMPLQARQFKLIDNSLHDIASGVHDLLWVEGDDNMRFGKLMKEGHVSADLPYINGEHLMVNGVPAKWDSVQKKIRKLNDFKKGEPIWRVGSSNGGTDIRPRDARQAFLADDILDTTKSLHFVLSKVAGAGKNFITTAACLKLLQMGHYDRLIVMKPMKAVDGEETGFLPGTKEEKIAPWFESFNDTMYELTDGGFSGTDLDARIELDIVTHMRGRSIPNTIIIVDEAQNFSEEALKTLITRAGEDTKVIIMGDLSQIDNPRLDAGNCGLRVWAERARHREVGFEDSTYIFLESNYRSKLSAWASSFYE